MIKTTSNTYRHLENLMSEIFAERKIELSNLELDWFENGSIDLYRTIQNKRHMVNTLRVELYNIQGIVNRRSSYEHIQKVHKDLFGI